MAYLSRRNGVPEVELLPSCWQDLAKPLAKYCQGGGKALPTRWQEKEHTYRLSNAALRASASR